MIAKFKRNNSVGATLGYNVKKDSILIDTGLLNGETKEDFIKEMEQTIRNKKNRSKINVFHSIISPAIEDGKKLNNDDIKKIVQRYIELMNLQGHQYAAYVHNDKGHKHIHIAICAYNYDTGLQYDYGNEYNIKLSQKVGKKIAQEMGFKNIQLISEEKKEKTILKELRIDNNKAIGVKEQITEIINKVLSLNINNLEQYFEFLEKKGLKVKPFFSKTDPTKIRGYGVFFGSDFYNISDINRNFTIANLEKNRFRLINDFKEGKIHKTTFNKENKEYIKFLLYQAINNLNYSGKNTIDNYFEELKKLGFKITQIKDKDNKIVNYKIGFLSNSIPIEYYPNQINNVFKLDNLIKNNFNIQPQTDKQIFIKDKKEIIKTLIIKAIENYKAKYLERKDIELFFKCLIKEGLKVEPIYKKGKLINYVLYYNGFKIYAGQVDKNFNLNCLMKNNFDLGNVILKNSTGHLKISSLENVSETIKKVLSLKPKNEEDYLRMLEEQGLTIKRHIFEGILRGYSILINGNYVNAYDINRKYTLKNLAKNGYDIKGFIKEKNKKKTGIQEFVISDFELKKIINENIFEKHKVLKTTIFKNGNNVMIGKQGKFGKSMVDNFGKLINFNYGCFTIYNSSQINRVLIVKDMNEAAILLKAGIKEKIIAINSLYQLPHIRKYLFNNNLRPIFVLKNSSENAKVVNYFKANFESEEIFINESLQQIRQMQGENLIVSIVRNIIEKSNNFKL